MSKVRIVQILCPQRHAILATAYESPDGAPIKDITDRLRYKADSLILDGGLNPWCGICQSRKWTYEDRPTQYTTMAEALPHFQNLADKQRTVREYLRASRG
jgi:hypothetical protein